jgi:hypothetical protein
MLTAFVSSVAPGEAGRDVLVSLLVYDNPDDQRPRRFRPAEPISHVGLRHTGRGDFV